ncbi:FHA domain-containing protein [Kribbella sancticallisti]|uniref:FHA domain-containing protein n=1 Tax=Kribbella sancticallisti TaxID=460087 RepID=UPI0031D4655B
MGNESFLSLGEQRWALPADQVSATIGRDPTADIRLSSDELVSRLHARLTRSGGAWSIADYGSRNGTLVNGRPLTTSVPLHDSDRIQIGDAVLTFHGPATSNADAAPARGPSAGRVRLVKVMVIAGVVEALGLAANSIAAFVADHAGGVVRWLVPPGLALLTAMVIAVIQAVSKEPASAPASNTRTTTAVARRRGTPAAAAILVVLLVVGLGGFAVAAGVQYAAGYVTGKESGEDRLVRPITKSGSGLIATVEHVFHTAHFTRVELTVKNTTETSLSLPLFGFCTFTGSDGTTLEADTFRSQWSDTIPPGTLQRGTITFNGHLPAHLTTASLNFSQVFGPSGKPLTIPGIKLNPG